MRVSHPLGDTAFGKVTYRGKYSSTAGIFLFYREERSEKREKRKEVVACLRMRLIKLPYITSYKRKIPPFMEVWFQINFSTGGKALRVADPLKHFDKILGITVERTVRI